jgi:LysM repeat protein
MKRISHIILASIILLFALLSQTERTFAQAGDASQLIAEVNGLRAAYGLPALKVDSSLMSAAQKHGNYQAQIGSWTHTGAGGSSPRDRAVAAGFGGGAQVVISENVAAGVNLSPNAAVYEMWQDALHLETMISPWFTHIGAGAGKSGDWVYYTLVVGYLTGSPGSGADVVADPPANAVEVTPASTSIPIEPISLATAAADGSIIHIVQSGQFLANIANVYDVNLADLMALNGFNEQTVIFPGEQILIRAGQTPENSQESVELETPLETAVTPTQTKTPTSRPATSTPSPVPVAMSDSTQASPVSVEPATPDEPAETKDTGSNLLLYVVFGLALSGTALILFGSTLKKRS